MRRLTVTGLLILAMALGIFLINDQLGTITTASNVAEFPEVVNVLPEVIPPVDEGQLEALLAKAKSAALDNGLEAVTIQYYMWTTRGEWYAAQGLIGDFGDPSVPFLVVSMPGTGFWHGPGANFGDGPSPIDGITLAYTALYGSFSGSISAFVSLPLIYEGPPLPDFNFPTLEPRPGYLPPVDAIPLPTALNQ